VDWVERDRQLGHATRVARLKNAILIFNQRSRNAGELVLVITISINYIEYNNYPLFHKAFLQVFLVIRIKYIYIEY